MKTTLKAHIEVTESEAKETIALYQAACFPKDTNVTKEDITVTIISDKPVVDDGWDYDIKKGEIIQADWEHRAHEGSNEWSNPTILVGEPLMISEGQGKSWRRPHKPSSYIYITTPEDKKRYAPKLATDEVKDCWVGTWCLIGKSMGDHFMPNREYRRRITTPPQKDIEWLQEHRDELIVMLADYSNITRHATTSGRSFQCASIYFDEQLTRLRSQKKDKV